MEDHKKLQFVQDFLAEVYGNEKPPLFEVNYVTVNALYELALKWRKTLEEDKIILAYKQQLATEYASQGDSL